MFFFPGVAYLVGIWALHAFMKNRQPVKSSVLTAFMFVHNVALSVGSGTLLLLIAHQLVKEYQAHVRGSFLSTLILS
jgi:hypothetical protein